MCSWVVPSGLIRGARHLGNQPVSLRLGHLCDFGWQLKKGWQLNGTGRFISTRVATSFVPLAAPRRQLCGCVAHRDGCVHTASHASAPLSDADLEALAGASSASAARQRAAALESAGEEVVSLAAALVDTASLSGFEQPLALALYPWLRRRGWDVTLQEVAPQRFLRGGERRFNVLATRPGVRNPRLLFNTHLDTVPPFIPATLEAGQLRGRGACDTKSLMAAQLLAAEGLVREGCSDIGLLFVVSEEVDHSGMQAANELGLSPEWLLVAEPTEGRVMQLQKGILKLVVRAAGVECHSGYPHLGRSATAALVATLHDLLLERWPDDARLGTTDLNVGTLQGGTAANVVAKEAGAELLFRLVGDPAPVLRRVHEICAGRVEVNIVAQNGPVDMGYVATELPGMPLGTACFNTDIPYFDFARHSKRQGRAVLYGHGSITDAHTPGEFIGIEDLQNCVLRFGELARRLLALRAQGSL